MFSYLWKNLSNMFSWQRFATSLPMVSNWFELIFFFPHISIKFLCLAAESVDQLLKWILIGHQQFSIELYFLGTKESFFWKFVAEADISFCRFFAQAPFRRKESFAISSTSLKKSSNLIRLTWPLLNQSWFVNKQFICSPLNLNFLSHQNPWT